MDTKKIGLIITIVFLVLVAVGAIFYIQTISSSNESGITPEVIMDEVINELPEDTNGGTRLNDQEQIKEALVEKNDWEAGDIELTITENDGTYASGMVGPIGGGPGGGMWFAKNVNGSWEIVWDGNGSIMCENLAEYPDFPTEIIPECYDSASGQMTER